MSVLRFSMNDRFYDVLIVARRPDLVVEIDGRRYGVREAADGSIDIDGQRLAFERAIAGDVAHVRVGGRSAAVGYLDPAAAAGEAGHGAAVIRATMPGTVVQVHRQAGDAVAAGDVVVTIESMKLQSRLAAARDGSIAELLKAEGETFEKGQVLATLAPIDGD